ncbi:MAG: FumA C-terminus/TtdB family hydratase beta subunit [Eggerthellaceae bacterium]
MAKEVRLTLPLDKAVLKSLHAGQACLLTGSLYTLRDAGHQRLLDEMGTSSVLPYGLEGQTIFYAGPTPEAAGRPFGAIGPTTASRMDFATPRLMECGIVATLGKGVRSEAVRQACIDCGGVYFVAVGGAAAYLAKCVTACETLAYEDLGTEALRKITVKDFPVFVGIDTQGNDIYSLT